jgi:antitoxin HicB
MNYHFKLKKEKSGFWAECIELKGCVTQADTIEELYRNASEALNLFLEEPDNSTHTFKLPLKSVKTKNVFEVSVDPRIAFALNMKIIRQKNGLTQKETADKLGMKNIYSYQRLESVKKANPNLSTITKIKSLFPDLKIDEIITKKSIIRSRSK